MTHIDKKTGTTDFTSRCGKRIVIRSLEKSDVLAAAIVCAEAMLDNPIHIRVFGTASTLRQRRLRRFFPGLLAYVYRKGDLYGAFADQTLVGVIGMLPPKQCKPSAYDFLRLLPSLVISNSPAGVVRLAIWLGTWAKMDPIKPHWHLGPLSVNPAWQQQGVGTQLLEFACSKGANDHLYLETDKLSNVKRYEKFGFTTLATPSILATPSWVMMRTSRK